MDHDQDFSGPVLSHAFGCPLIDDLLRRLRAGDKEALKFLMPAIKQDMPHKGRIAFRDSQIRLLAIWLISLHSERPSRHYLATIISIAGSQLTHRRHLPQRSPFDRFNAAEIAELSDRIRQILELCPDWPELRQTLTILSK
jgi:hypothetical protein